MTCTLSTDLANNGEDKKKGDGGYDSEDEHRRKLLMYLTEELISRRVLAGPSESSSCKEVLYDILNRRSRGSAFVKMSSIKEVEAAAKKV